MLASSGFSPAHVILVVFATPGESQATEIAQLCPYADGRLPRSAERRLGYRPRAVAVEAAVERSGVDPEVVDRIYTVMVGMDAANFCRSFMSAERP